MSTCCHPSRCVTSNTTAAADAANTTTRRNSEATFSVSIDNPPKYYRQTVVLTDLIHPPNALNIPTLAPSSPLAELVALAFPLGLERRLVTTLRVRVATTAASAAAASTNEARQ